MSEKPIFKRIVVGYDGSGNAERALAKAVGLSRRSNAELTVVVVADTGRYTSTVGLESLYKQINEKTRENADNLAESALRDAKEAGVDAYATVEVGHPADMILGVAMEQKADLIVVGRRGVSSLERFLMGSVSTAVINNAKSDVLVVK